LGQDGAFEGVYGQYMTLTGSKVGGEIRVNTTIAGKQMQPSLGVDNTGRYLAVWSCYKGVNNGSFDLDAQRYSAQIGTLPVPAAPFVSALDQSRLTIAWADLAGYPVSFYELYMDGLNTPVVVNGNQTTISNLAANSTHTFKLLYQLTDGRRSDLS